MNDNIAFVLKILILSTVLSVLIKYGGQFLPISPTITIAIALILLPSIVVAIALSWRAQQQLPINDD